MFRLSLFIRNAYQTVFKNDTQRTTHDHLLYYDCPDVLSLVEFLSGDACVSPNRIQF